MNQPTKNCWTCINNKLGTLTLFGTCMYKAKWGKGPPEEISPEIADVGCENYQNPKYKAKKTKEPQVAIWDRL